MKKLIFAVLIIMLIGSTACNSKDNTVSTPSYAPVAAEIPAIEAFLNTNGLTMTMSPDSIWYHVSNYGDTLHGRLTRDSATAIVSFTCTTLDGTLVYQTPSGSPVTIDYATITQQTNNIFIFDLSYFLYSGPQYFLMGKGTTFSFIIPSMYQYIFFGTSSYTINGVTVQSGMPLYYTVQFVDKQPS